MLQYIENGTDKKIVDNTGKKVWIKKKADKLGLILNPLWEEGVLPSTPQELKDDLKNASDLTGWSKSLDGMPNFTVNDIKLYHENITKLFCKKSTAIKKHFIRGEQFIEERFVDLTNVYAKQSDNCFLVKGISSASLKKANRWMFLALDKDTSRILYAHCQCPAGKAGTCSHAYALMKLVAKWVIDRLSIVPEDKACTSKPCIWSVPQAKGRTDKIPLMDIQFVSPDSKKTKG